MITHPSPSPAPLARWAAAGALVVFVAAWYWLTFGLGTDAGDSVFLVVVLGVIVPSIIVGVTRRNARDNARPAPATGAQALTVIAYLVVFALLILGAAFTSLKQALPTEPLHDIVVTGLKLVTMVALPWLMLARMGRDRLPDLRPHWRRIALPLVVVGAVLLGVQAVFGRGLANLAALHPSALTLAIATPACFLWMSLSAGLNEELLFRVFLQDRLAAWLRSPVAGVLCGALLFGLAHAPGLYLRGAAAMEGADQVSVAWAICYSIVVIAPAGIAFGVLWLRTRSLWLGVILHGAMDTIPNLAGFVRDWL